MTKVKADLHNHLRTSSRCFKGDFNKAIDIASRKLGNGGIFGMVNFSDKRYEDFIGIKGYERVYLGENKNGVYVPEKDILVVRGQEVPTKQGHLLVLGTRAGKHLKEGRSLEDTLREAKDNQGIIISDHSFYIEGSGKYLEKNPLLLRNFDAIEVHNGVASFGLPFGPLPCNANKKAQSFYEKVKLDNPHLGAISTSDGHSFYELGSSWTLIDKPNLEKENFIPSLRNAIRKTDSYTLKKMKNSYVGAIDHIIDLVFITQVASRIGLKIKFETERLE